MKKLYTALIVLFFLCITIQDSSAQSRERLKDRLTAPKAQSQESQQSQSQTKETGTAEGSSRQMRTETRKLLEDIFTISKQQIEQREKLKADLTKGVGVKSFKKSARLKLPFVSKQHDGWSCGLHSATRLLKFNNYDVSYEDLRKQRQIITAQLNSDQGPYTLPPGLQMILRQKHQDSWAMTDVEFDVIKNLLRQQKPVAALMLLQGKSLKVQVGNKKLAVPATHWIVLSGFDDNKKIVYYYDPYKEEEQKKSYDDFMKVWAYDPAELMGKSFDPLLLTYGFIASRTIAFCN